MAPRRRGWLVAGVLTACAAAGPGQATPARTAARGAQTGGGSGVEAAALAAHASARAAVGVGPLRWSPALAAQARDWAQHLCRISRGNTATLVHRPDNAHGENLYWQGGSAEAPGVEAAVASWAAERREYDPRTGRCRGMCGHYTQMVWRATAEVGCGLASCGVQHFWVCNYDPPGNFVGQRPY